MNAKQGPFRRISTNPKVNSRTALLCAGLLAAVGGAWSGLSAQPVVGAPVIIQAKSLTKAAGVVAAAGGAVSRELAIIDAVSATLTPSQVGEIAGRCPECRIYSDRATVLMGSSVPDPDPGFPTLISANILHMNGVTGKGVTVAVVDSGFLNVAQYQKNKDGVGRVRAQYDALTNTVRTKSFATDDIYGHGAHVTGLIASSKQSSTGLYQGIAPDADLVSVKAFDQNGGSTYATLIQAIGWVVSNKTKYNIRVLNASFGAPVGSWYWDDPMNQAIMKAWQAGIVVVASAGNTGPAPMSIQAPGNVPYVITVGAMTDNYTPLYGQDDYLASFSAAGPTYEAHVKPDLVAPGGHDISYIQRTSTLGVTFPQYFLNTTSGYYKLSGTSQAAAVVSGVAALMLQAFPNLSPDDVKCGLMATAQAGRKRDGTVPYSVFQQGAGLVNAWSAVYDRRTGCANNGLDIAADLAGTKHFAGQASQNTDGSFFVKDSGGEGSTWTGTYTSTGGYPWSTGYPWSSGYPWSNGYPWSSGYPWSNGYPWSTSTSAPSGGSYAIMGDSGSESLMSPTGDYVVVPGKVVPSITTGVTVVKPAIQQ